jgi:hypothetical protein
VRTIRAGYHSRGIFILNRSALSKGEKGFFLRLRTQLFAILAIFPSHAYSQITVETPTIHIYAQCLNEAIQAHHITKHGQAIAFTCIGTAAKALYDLLGRSGYETNTSHFNTGEYLARSTGTTGYSDNCFQKTEDASGVSVAGSFSCNIFLFVGPLLNQ